MIPLPCLRSLIMDEYNVARVKCHAHHRRDPTKISARNQFQGTVVEIVKGATTAHVRLDIGDAIVTLAITNAAVEELGLAVGEQAYAVVKASDAMLAVD